MANDTSFFINFAESIKASLHVAAPARVVKVNGDGTADVKPLYKENGEEWPLILSAPSLRHVGPLIEGDVVWVTFADRPLDNMSGSRSFNPEFSGKHRLIDGVITGVFA